MKKQKNKGGWLDKYQDAGQLRAATSYQGAHQNPVAYEQKVNAKEFTLTFHFNFYDIEFLLNKSKIIELGDVPTIIQRF